MNRLLLAVLATSGIGLLGSNTMPIFVGALMESFALDEAGVGLLGSVELSGVAIGALVLTPLVARVSRRNAALVGTAVVALGYVGAALAPTPAPFGIARFCAGVGAGAVAAAGNAAASADRDPDRLFARVALWGGAIAALMLFGLPRVVSAAGFRPGYWVLVGIALLSVPLIWLLPPMHAEQRERGPLPRPALGVATLAGLTLFSVADQALWTFTERIATRVGLSLDAIGVVLGVATIVGLIGALAAARIGVTRGRTLPLGVGLVGILAVRVALAQAPTPVAYVALQLVWAIAFLFLVPYTLGTAAALDRRGRWAAAAAAATMAGTAIGPGVAGWCIARWGPGALGGFLGITSLGSTALLVAVSVRLDRGPVTSTASG